MSSAPAARRNRTSRTLFDFVPFFEQKEERTGRKTERIRKLTLPCSPFSTFVYDFFFGLRKLRRRVSTGSCCSCVYLFFHSRLNHDMEREGKGRRWLTGGWLFPFLSFAFPFFFFFFLSFSLFGFSMLSRRRGRHTRLELGDPAFLFSLFSCVVFASTLELDFSFQLLSWDRYQELFCFFPFPLYLVTFDFSSNSGCFCLCLCVFW